MNESLVTLIVEAYWPVTILVIFGVLIFLFRSRITKLVFKTTYGELLMELNDSKKIVSEKYDQQLKQLDATDLWSLNDLSKKPDGIGVSSMNPVQKFAYMKLKTGPFISVSDGKVTLTEEGLNAIKLAEELDL